VVLRELAYGGGSTAALIAAIQQELIERYGGPDETPVDPADFAPPDGVFLVAQRAGEIVACAGLRRHGEDAVELKRMYVRPAHRRTGLGRLLLGALEEHARRSGHRQLVLETGTGQPEAIALYESAGYLPVPPFGHYADAPESRSYGKAL